MDELDEAMDILKTKRREELTNEELADRFDCSESTISRRLKLARQHERRLLKEQEEKKGEGKIRDVGGGDGSNELAEDEVADVIKLIEQDEKTAESVGQITGVNMNTLVSGIRKATQGEANRQELGALAKNAAGVVLGFHTAESTRGGDEPDDGERTQKKETYTRNEVEDMIEDAIREKLEQVNEDKGGDE